VESVNFGELFATDLAPTPDAVVIYIPDRDRDNKPVTDHEKWVNDALELLTRINDGATAYPPGEGRWKKKDGSGIIHEKTQIVYSYVTSAKRFTEALPELRDFLFRLGRDTRQEAVSFEFQDIFFTIPSSAYIVRE